MASDDTDGFKPRPGRIRSRGSGAGRTYLQRVLKTAGLAGPGVPRAGASAFSGARIGRGGGYGTGAALRGTGAGTGRRVVVKARIVPLRRQGLGAARAHLRYVQRDGIGRDGAPGRLYDAASDRADGSAFLERSGGDRHQFRLIVSPEDGTALDDLKPFVRGLMAEMERDLDTRLDWVAVDHVNTDNPHSHIVVRGRDGGGRDLVIARDYIAHGIRARASALLTLELGPVSANEILQGYRREVAQARFTRLDRDILREAKDGVADLRRDPDDGLARARHALKIGRLQTLERMGLAEPAGARRWRLAAGLEATLRDLGSRGDIIRTMHRQLRAGGHDRAAGDYAIFDATDPGARIVGRVIARGLADELHDRHSVIVDGLDGRTHYAEVGELADPGEFDPGVIVAVEGRMSGPRPADRTIAAIADRSGGLYSEALHRAADPGASGDYLRAHVRRLEALRRAGVGERLADGTWAVPEDFLDRAEALEAAQRLRQPARLTLLSGFGLAAMVEAEGATWLDRQLVAERPEPVRAAGFGREVEDALERRRRWLIARGLARDAGGRTLYQRTLLEDLRRRELSAAGERLARELGKPFAAAVDGGRIDGVYLKPLRLVSGRFAVIEQARTVSLVPWRAALERHRGRRIGGVVRGDGIAFDVTRTRGPGLSPG